MGRNLMEDSILIYSLEEGFGELFWNSCPICGGSSVRTIYWEDGTTERNECLICKRMWEIMELEESFTAGNKAQ